MVDDLGNTGKFYLIRYLASNYDAVIFSGGKNDRIQHQYEGEKTVVFDFPRALHSTDKDFVSYMAIEAIKNGMTSRMYGERTLFVSQILHVVCFFNFDPDLIKFSQDRWDITYLIAADQYDASKVILIIPDVPDDFDDIIDMIQVDFEEEFILGIFSCFRVIMPRIATPPPPAPVTLKRANADLVSSDEEYRTSDSDEEFLRKCNANSLKDRRRDNFLNAKKK